MRKPGEFFRSKSKRFTAGEINEIRKLVIENRELFKNKWNEYFNEKSGNAVDVWFIEVKMCVRLDDGREVAVPIYGFPTLIDSTEKQRNNWRLIGGGEEIHWEDLDEDILVGALF